MDEKLKRFEGVGDESPGNRDYLNEHVIKRLDIRRKRFHLLFRKPDDASDAIHMIGFRKFCPNPSPGLVVTIHGVEQTIERVVERADAVDEIYAADLS